MAPPGVGGWRGSRVGRGGVRPVDQSEEPLVEVELAAGAFSVAPPEGSEVPLDDSEELFDELESWESVDVCRVPDDDPWSFL